MITNVLNSIFLLCKYFHLGNAKISNCLFIFDDIWDPEYFNYLTFAKKSIVTSRFNHEKYKDTYHCIPAKVRDSY